MEPEVSQRGWTDGALWRSGQAGEPTQSVQESREAPFSDPPQIRSSCLAAARERHAVLFKSSTFFAISSLAGWGSPPRPLLMSALPALAPPAPTSPARGSLQLGADSPAPARWLQTRGHARRWGSPGTRGRGRARKAPASSRPPLAVRVEVGGARAPAQQSRVAVAASLFYPNELRSVSGTGPKKSRKSCLPPGQRSPSSLCLESQHLRLRCVPGE